MKRINFREVGLVKCFIFLFSILVCLQACIHPQDRYIPDPEPTPNPGPDPDPDPDPDEEYEVYMYPFHLENKDVSTVLSLELNETPDLAQIEVFIPPLKYNKSLLLLMTQDDCMQTAYCCTWAAIHGKPLTKEYYYDAPHLWAGDLPPDAYSLGKTLGSTDGAGNEVRFAFTTTLAPEWEFMDAECHINKGFTDNFYRFYMKSGLIWINVYELLNYGVGIAFHDVNTEDIYTAGTVSRHYGIAQDIILDKLGGRGCKVLAEPNGNKTYVEAAMNYDPIQIMTAQAGARMLYPFAENTDLYKDLLERRFYEPAEVQSWLNTCAGLPVEERTAIQVGLHRTDTQWAEFLLWLNDTYGKDGEDNLWMPNLEEYYEYNYYRQHSTIDTSVEGNKLKLNLTLPSSLYFYYPSVTLNIKGIGMEQITSLLADSEVSGLSYAAYEEGVMVNIDCRRYLVQHATRFVEKYEKSKSNPDKQDAAYFVNMLKDSSEKEALLARIK